MKKCWHWFFACSVGLVSSESGLSHIDVIVLNEVHYLSDISRGTVWEEIVRFPFSYFSLIFKVLYFFSFTECSLTGVQISVGYILPQRSSTYTSVSNSCKSRWVGWLDRSGTMIIFWWSLHILLVTNLSILNLWQRNTQNIVVLVTVLVSIINWLSYGLMRGFFLFF